MIILHLEYKPIQPIMAPSDRECDMILKIKVGRFSDLVSEIELIKSKLPYGSPKDWNIRVGSDDDMEDI